MHYETFIVLRDQYMYAFASRLLFCVLYYSFGVVVLIYQQHQKTATLTTCHLKMCPVLQKRSELGFPETKINPDPGKRQMQHTAQTPLQWLASPDASS